ncbi:3-oxoacyl-[acyl-carrier protein] reductase [Labilithrix luteola]|uniref:3-oxoacyl-[acyl-carrier-protein] reductase n=1 Tax=Labilithrix luteola TaxID=1391654 RepID=A0A0K1QCY9_9BACT|nr:3-oxoacyl-[acyl-carrier-protein] reductase [Labilithrix luteola]AKV03651.1 3-oxoacyl-[acyl-carrier protein] reductase [Labilithrix luteola]
MFKLDGKIALVTGGSRGIGRSICEALAEQGATVVVNYVKGEAQAREVADGIIARGGKAEIMGFDVADMKAAETAVEEVVKKHGKLDILVANAGISIDGLLLRLKEEDIDRLVQVNLKGSLACARAATKAMMRAKTGRVIFLSSVVGEMGNVGQTAYSATKAALLGAAKSIAREFASRNITVNAVAPGFIDTDMTSTMTDQMKDFIVKSVPLARTGTSREVAAACAFLASDEAAYVTGQVIRVNGGMYV